MGNVVSWISSFWQLELEMAILGLQNAGKSSLVSLIAGNDADDVIVPTVGYHFERIVKGNVTLKVWDLGGSPRFREMWPRYVRGAHVVVFVVDSANAGEMSIAKQELHAIMSHPRMKHIPVLVMANKSDLPHASAPERVGEQLDLPKLEAHRDVALVSASCKTRENIDSILKFLMEYSE